jgi:hypothetical protein
VAELHTNQFILYPSLTDQSVDKDNLQDGHAIFGAEKDNYLG